MDESELEHMYGEMIDYKSEELKRFAFHYQSIVLENRRLLEHNEKLEKEVLNLKRLIHEVIHNES